MLAAKKMPYFAASRRQLVLLGALCAVFGAVGGFLPILFSSGGSLIGNLDLFVTTAVVAVVVDWYRSCDHLARPFDWGGFLVVLSLAALPGAATGWLALVLCGALGLWREDPNERGAGQLLVALGLLALKERIWGGLLQGTVLDLEAWLIGTLLDLASVPVEVTGNVMVLADGRELVILRGCSIFSLIVPALIGTMAISRLIWPNHELKCRCICLVGLLVLGINLVRLLGMTLSPGSYELLHEGVGKTVLRILVTVIVFGVGAWGCGLKR